MAKFELNGSWELSWNDEGGSHETDAQVPGNVIGDLFRNKVIPDPYFGCNSDHLRKYEFIDWEYTTSFRKPAVSSRQKLRLVFEGIDTIAASFLEFSEMNISEIAEYMGFPNVFAFSAFFRHHTGLPPSSYRSGKRNELPGGTGPANQK